MKMYF